MPESTPAESPSAQSTEQQPDWPYEYVERGEIRDDLSQSEVVALIEELERLRRKADEWSCDLCGENQSVVTNAGTGTQKCRSCLFSDDTTTAEQTALPEEAESA